MTDHELAAYLRSRGAIDRWEKMGALNKWMDQKGQVVAAVFYEGATERRVYLPG